MNFHFLLQFSLVFAKFKALLLNQKVNNKMHRVNNS